MQSERTVSLWQSDKTGDDFTRSGFNGDLSAEIVVIGAGITGLSVAYQLAVDGRQVVVIDDGDIGGGNTGRTTAHLSSVLDDRFVNLRRERGKDIARIVADSHGAAIDWIERVHQEEGIDCSFRRLDGYLLLGDGDDEKLLDEELEAARDAGLPVEKLAQAPAGLPTVPALRVSNQAASR
jgi:glycine/D-amino acid oxidase-like deaminating enzyme